MRTELGNRGRGQMSNVLALSIVLDYRPRLKDAGVALRRDFLAALKKELPEALRRSQKGSIAPAVLAKSPSSRPWPIAVSVACRFCPATPPIR